MYVVEYYSMKRNEFESVELRWMNPKSVIQSELRERKTNIVYKGIEKMVLMNLFAAQE